MSPKELRELSDQELEQRLQTARRELVTLRLRKGVGQLSDTSVLQKTRREIARILTVLRERSLGRDRESARG
jgi:large subunit ribosomal protein L29